MTALCPIGGREQHKREKIQEVSVNSSARLLTAPRLLQVSPKLPLSLSVTGTGHRSIITEFPNDIQKIDSTWGRNRGTPVL